MSRAAMFKFSAAKQNICPNYDKKKIKTVFPLALVGYEVIISHSPIVSGVGNSPLKRNKNFLFGNLLM